MNQELTHTPSITAMSTEVREAKLRFGIVGSAPTLVEAVQRALRVAPIDLSVLVTGESGSGKEFFPQIIHNYSPRKHSRFIAVNCGAIPEGTIDSELFGHEKGAFTGAIATRKGYFEEADGGTIFLDEVAELPLTTQARLLRVLESGEFIKVGSSTVQHTNIRVVAATNVDLPQAIRAGRFREDLYYRLSTVHITVPPLRERGSDITLLARKFAADFAERYRIPAIEFDADTLRAIAHYSWPGNVRQLKNVIDQVALFEAGTTINADRLKAYLPDVSTSMSMAPVTVDGSHTYGAERELLFNMLFSMRNEIDTLRATIETMDRGASEPTISTAPSSTPGPSTTHAIMRYSPLPRHVADVEPIIDDTQNSGESGLTLEDTERETIRRSLERNDGRRKATAIELNISERTLYRKIKEYGLE